MDQKTLQFASKRTFPETKYMGSKQRLLPAIRKAIEGLNVDRILDAFCGTSCVSYLFKQMGASVVANDMSQFCHHIARATIENDSETISTVELDELLNYSGDSKTFIRDTYGGLFFYAEDCGFLDSMWAAIQLLDNSYKRSIALAAVARACIKKRPRGLFTVASPDGEDGRRDERLSLKDHFVTAVAEINSCIFGTGVPHVAMNRNVFDLPDDISDAVYLDPPYISKYSDSDYTRRYHFVEGFCNYWQTTPPDMTTKTRKIESYDTEFAGKTNAVPAFERLFDKFRRAVIVLSYSSNGIPDIAELTLMLKRFKATVEVVGIPLKYSHGNQRRRVGDNHNSVQEYILVAK